MARSGLPNKDAKAAEADARLLKELFDESAAAKAFVADNAAMDAVDIEDLSTDEIEQSHSAAAAPAAKALSVEEVVKTRFNAINADARIKAYAAYLELAKLLSPQSDNKRDREIQVGEMIYQPIIEALTNGDITLAAFPTTENSNDGLTRATAFITQEYTRLLNTEPDVSPAAAPAMAAAEPALDKWADAAPARKAADEEVARKEQEEQARRVEAERAEKMREAEELKKAAAMREAELRRVEEQKRNDLAQKQQTLNAKIREFKTAASGLKRDADLLGPSSTYDQIVQVQRKEDAVRSLASTLKRDVQKDIKELGLPDTNAALLELRVLEIINGFDTAAISSTIRISQEVWEKKRALVQADQDNLSGQLDAIRDFIKTYRSDQDVKILKVSQHAVQELREAIASARARLGDYPQDIQNTVSEYYARLNTSVEGVAIEVTSIQKSIYDAANRAYGNLKAIVDGIKDKARNVPRDAKNIQADTSDTLRIKALAANELYDEEARRYREMLETLPIDTANIFRERVGYLDKDKATELARFNKAIDDLPGLITEARDQVAAEEKALDGVIQLIAKVAKANPAPNIDADVVAGYREELRKLQQQYRVQEQRYIDAINNLPVYLQPSYDVASKIREKDAAVRNFETGIIAKSEMLLAKIQSYTRIQASAEGLDAKDEKAPAGVKGFDAKDEKVVVRIHREYASLLNAYERENAARLPSGLEGHIAIASAQSNAGLALNQLKEKLQGSVGKIISGFTDELGNFLEGTGLSIDKEGGQGFLSRLKGLRKTESAMLDERGNSRSVTRQQVDAVKRLLPELDRYEARLESLRDLIHDDKHTYAESLTGEYRRVVGLLPRREDILAILEEADASLEASDEQYHSHLRILEAIQETRSLEGQRNAIARQVENESNPENTNAFLRQLDENDPRRREIEILIENIRKDMAAKERVLLDDITVFKDRMTSLAAVTSRLDGLANHISLRDQPNIVASPSEIESVEKSIVEVEALRALPLPVRRGEDSLPSRLEDSLRTAVSAAGESIRQARNIIAAAKVNRAEREAGVRDLSLQIAAVRQQVEVIEFKEEEPVAQLQAKWKYDQHRNALSHIQGRMDKLFDGVHQPGADQKDGIEVLRGSVARELKDAERVLELKNADYQNALDRRRVDEGDAKNAIQGLRTALRVLEHKQGSWDFNVPPEIEGAPAAIVIVPDPNPTRAQIDAAQLAENEFLEKVEAAGDLKLPADLKSEIKAVVNEVKLNYDNGNYEKANNSADKKWNALKTNVQAHWTVLDGAIVGAQKPVDDLRLHQQNVEAQRQALEAKPDFPQKIPLLQTRMVDEKKLLENEAKQAAVIDAAIPPAMQLLSELPADLKAGMINNDPPALAPKVADAKQINNDGKFYRGIVKKNAVTDWVRVLNNELDRAIAQSDHQHRVILDNEFKRLNDMKDMARSAFKDLNAQEPAGRAGQFVVDQPLLDDDIRRLEDNIRRFQHLVAYQEAFAADEKERVAEQKALAANLPLVAGRANVDEEKRRAMIRKHIEIPRLQWLLIQRQGLYLGSDESLLYRTLNKTAPPPGFNAWMRANPNATVVEINKQLKSFFAELSRANAAGFQYQGPVADFKDDLDRENLVTGVNLAAIRAQRVAVNNNYKVLANAPANIDLQKPDAIAPQGKVLTPQEEKASARHQTKLADTFMRDLLIQRGHAVRVDADLAAIRNFDYRNGNHAQFVGLVNQQLINRVAAAEEKNIITEVEFRRAKGIYLENNYANLHVEYQQRTNHLKDRLNTVRAHAREIIKHQQHYQTGNVPAEYKHVVASLGVRGVSSNSTSALLALRNFNYREGTQQDFHNIVVSLVRNQHAINNIPAVFAEAQQMARQAPDLNAEELRQNQRILAETIDANLEKLRALRGEVAEVKAIAVEFAALNDPNNIDVCRDNIEGKLHIPRSAEDKVNPADVNRGAWAQLSRMDRIVVAVREAPQKVLDMDARLSALDREIEDLNKLKREIPEEYRQESQKKTFFTAAAEIHSLSDMDEQLKRFGVSATDPRHVENMQHEINMRVERRRQILAANPAPNPAVQGQINTLDAQIAAYRGRIAQVEYTARTEEKIKVTRALSDESEARFSGVELKNENGQSTRAMFAEHLVKTDSGDVVMHSDAYVSDDMTIAKILLSNTNIQSELEPALIFGGGLNDVQRGALCFALDDWLHDLNFHPTKKNILTFLDAIAENTTTLKVQPRFRAVIESANPGATEAQILAAVDSNAEAIKKCMQKSYSTSRSDLAEKFEKAIDDSVGLRREWRGPFTLDFGVPGAEPYQFQGGYKYIPCDAMIKLAKAYVHNACAHDADAVSLIVKDIKNPALLVAIDFEVRAENLKRELLNLPRLNFINATKYDDPPSPSHPAVGYYIKYCNEVINPTMDERFQQTHGTQVAAQQSATARRLDTYARTLQGEVKQAAPRLDKNADMNVEAPLSRKPGEAGEQVKRRHHSAHVMRQAQRHGAPPQNPGRQQPGGQGAPGGQQPPPRRRNP